MFLQLGGVLLGRQNCRINWQRISDKWITRSLLRTGFLLIVGRRSMRNRPPMFSRWDRLEGQAWQAASHSLGLSGGGSCSLLYNAASARPTCSDERYSWSGKRLNASTMQSGACLLAAWANSSARLSAFTPLVKNGQRLRHIGTPISSLPWWW